MAIGKASKKRRPTNGTQRQDNKNNGNGGLINWLCDDRHGVRRGETDTQMEYNLQMFHVHFPFFCSSSSNDVIFFSFYMTAATTEAPAPAAAAATPAAPPAIKAATAGLVEATPLRKQLGHKSTPPQSKQ